jgi:hypothetical protein
LRLTRKLRNAWERALPSIHTDKRRCCDAASPTLYPASNTARKKSQQSDWEFAPPIKGKGSLGAQLQSHEATSSFSCADSDVKPDAIPIKNRTPFRSEAGQHSD